MYNETELDNPRPLFDAKKHTALCMELKMMYVLITRTKQNLIFYDEDVASRSPLLDLWKERDLVDFRPLDDNIRGMFHSRQSTPAEWAIR